MVIDSMDSSHCPRLVEFIKKYPDDRDIAAVASALHSLMHAAPRTVDRADLINLYRRSIPVMESLLWRNSPPDEDDLQLYQALCREMESHHGHGGVDERHDIVIVVPVADRPLHLAECMGSIFSLCEHFGYGGQAKGRYRKVSVIVADDSEQPANIQEQRTIAQNYRDRGLDVDYFGLVEQLSLIEGLSHDQRTRLERITGKLDTSAFHHKGASITRNITYIKLRSMVEDGTRPLFYFIDSDQEFRLNCSGENGEQTLSGLNYFHHLDEIFSTRQTRVLTGKVVGDPPVSPAVMAGNLLDDVIAFFQQLAAVDAGDACRFHGNPHRHDDASYHDMAELFGFRPVDTPYEYSCRIPGHHTHEQCYRRFAGALNHFFDGEHPTRKTGFEYQDVNASVKPARTVYTGNYVITPEALDYFIPFAPLRLRMAGPVLGRLMRASLGEGFVSASLPMLHKRTVDALGQSEFRAGIQHGSECIDLSAEFERQYYGDVMLFSMEKLVQTGYPGDFSKQQVRDVLHDTERYLNDKYREKHESVLEKNARLRKQFNRDDAWWRVRTELGDANHQVTRFIDNIEYNFSDDSRAWRMINDEQHRRQRMEQLLDAITGYGDDCEAWRLVLDRET